MRTVSGHNKRPCTTSLMHFFQHAEPQRNLSHVRRQSVGHEKIEIKLLWYTYYILCIYINIYIYIYI